MREERVFTVLARDGQSVIGRVVVSVDWDGLVRELVRDAAEASARFGDDACERGARS